MMAFYVEELLKNWDKHKIDSIYSRITEREVIDAIEKDECSVEDLIALLSPQAKPHLEKIAQKAHQLTRRYFGRTISLYAPLYISNLCASDCLYCCFAPKSGIREKRVTLTESQIEEECAILSNKGLKTVLLLTGDAPKQVPVDYIKEAVQIAKRYFWSVQIEVYAMDTEDYAKLADAGTEGVTLYMETYDREVYEKVHLSGRKRDFQYRLHALERAGNAGIRKLTCGILLGLSDWHYDVIWLALHAQYLQRVCWQSVVAVSFPRLKHTPPRFSIPYPVELLEFVQIVTAMRLFLPRSPFNLSTREPAYIRDHFIPLGITSMSAGSSTRPGGYKVYKDTPIEERQVLGQFEIDDTRSVEEVVQAIQQKGYDPVWVDFEPGFIR